MQNTCEIPRYHSLISFTMKNWLMKNSFNQQITQIIGAIHKQYSIEIVGSISVKNGKSVRTAEYTHKKRRLIIKDHPSPV